MIALEKGGKEHPSITITLHPSLPDFFADKIWALIGHSNTRLINLNNQWLTRINHFDFVESRQFHHWKQNTIFEWNLRLSQEFQVKSSTWQAPNQLVQLGCPYAAVFWIMLWLWSFLHYWFRIYFYFKMIKIRRQWDLDANERRAKLLQ